MLPGGRYFRMSSRSFAFTYFALPSYTIWKSKSLTSRLRKAFLYLRAFFLHPPSIARMCSRKRLWKLFVRPMYRSFFLWDIEYTTSVIFRRPKKIGRLTLFSKITTQSHCHYPHHQIEYRARMLVQCVWYSR